MFRMSVIPALAVCAAGLVIPSIAAAQTKIGVVNLQKAILDTRRNQESFRRYAGEIQAPAGCA